MKESTTQSSVPTAVQASAGVAPSRPFEPGGSEGTGQRPKALVVDDDPIMLGLLGRYLNHAGYETITTKEADQVMPLAIDCHPAVILLDVMMPGMSGLAVLRLLHKTETTKDIPVLVMTANDRPETKTESLAGGAAAFLVKPFGLNQFLAEITRITTKASKA